MSWDEIPELIKSEIRQLEHILSNFPYVADKINLHNLKHTLMDTYALSVNKADMRDDRSMQLKIRLSKFQFENYNHDVERFKDAIMLGDKDEKGKLRYQWLKFKSKYLIWARNFISKLNRIKMQDAPWLDVRAFAKEVAQLEMSEWLVNEVNSICEKLKTRGEKDEMIDDLIDYMVNTMLKQVEKAEVSTSLNRDSNDRVVGRSYDNSYPKWYRNLGVRNKAHFQQVIKQKRGPVYDRIEKVARELLLNGFKTTDDYEMPNNTYRTLVGLNPYDDDNNEVPF